MKRQHTLKCIFKPHTQGRNSMFSIKTIMILTYTLSSQSIKFTYNTETKNGYVIFNNFKNHKINPFYNWRKYD